MAHARITRDRMFDWIEERLAADQPMPSDAEIADRFGFSSPESARTLLSDLSDAGRITILSWDVDRRIALGRVRAAAAVATRPAPAIRKADPVLEAGLAKIAAALARRPGRIIGAPAPAASEPARPSPEPAPTAPDPIDASPEEETMPLQSEVRNITIQARGALRAAIEQRAEAKGVALGQVAKALVEAALAAEQRSVDAPSVPPIFDLATIGTSDLLHELGIRLHAGSPELVGAAVARAEAAEGRLATVQQQLRGLLGG